MSDTTLINNKRIVPTTKAKKKNYYKITHRCLTLAKFENDFGIGPDIWFSST